MNLLRLLAVEVDQVGDVGHLGAGLRADLAGLRLHGVGDLVLVGEQPVAQLPEPPRPLLVAERLPCGLVSAHALDHLAHALRPVDGEGLDDRPSAGLWTWREPASGAPSPNRAAAALLGARLDLHAGPLVAAGSCPAAL